jgi:hypothetical protein
MVCAKDALVVIMTLSSHADSVSLGTGEPVLMCRVFGQKSRTCGSNTQQRIVQADYARSLVQNTSPRCHDDNGGLLLLSSA